MSDERDSDHRVVVEGIYDFEQSPLTRIQFDADKIAERLVKQDMTRTWECLPDLRWYSEYVQQPQRLQQARRCLETREIEWQDVQREYGPDAGI